ncbi:L-type lectin-domain containing receptor kinase IX.1-like [Impatiens glandulifera]|uniref:L-type lectin-domain containing receptor kinase IX.1-like n=1 Tax=Impatiens glandulifera TaxID=253017 RepID=UPI001FB17409|nr:L-type lectin-domain containing receptor kinase IX.1-like [Impatiens glandulifera]
MMMIMSSINITLISSLQFEFSRFDAGLTDIAYQGVATPNGQGAIQMSFWETLFRVGWASYAKKVPIWDPETGQVTDFTTHFSFIIDARDGPYRGPYGDGIAFFIAPFGSLLPLNSGGEYFGLLNTTTVIDTSRNQFIAVEFDMFQNPRFDPQYDHVGIDVNTLRSVVTSPWNASIYSKNVIDVWIAYNSSTTDLTVNWANKTETNSTLTLKVDLKNVLPQWVMLGFTCATGLLTSDAVIQSWEFSSSLDIKEQSGTTTRSDINLILGLSLSIGSIIVAILLAITLKAICKSKDVDNNEFITSMNVDLERGLGPHPFSYEDLALATNNFSEARKLGEGGFGSVYKGYLISLDLLIAVKKVSKSSKQGKKEYVTEVKIISQLRHRNLVQLIGWCHDHGGEFLLVYEFMPNGSLDVHLFGKKPVLNWITRHKIALGLASALLYLHEEWEQCVIHRDIKSSNIMLDSSFNVKLGDFGLARLADHEHGPDTTGLAGTLGYMAPEYLRTGRASKESDVYSFGVVILEIVTGMRCRDSKLADEFPMGFVEWVWDLHGKGKVVDAIDKRMNQDLNDQEVECFVVVGLWCVHPDPSLRPSMKQASRVLHFESPFPILPIEMPVPTYLPLEMLVPTYHPQVESNAPIITSHDSLISSSSMQDGR